MNSDEFIAGLIKDRGLIQEAFGLDEQSTVRRLVSRLKSLPKRETKIISLVGGAGSGKSTLAGEIGLSLKSAAIIGTDDFVLGPRKFRRKFMEVEGKDPLLKYDFALLREKIEQIKRAREGEAICLPLYESRSGTGLDIEYDPQTGRILNISRDVCEREIGKVDFLIVEGDFQILAAPDYQIFLHVSDEVRLHNRISRDLRERGPTTPEEITENFYLRQRFQHVPCTRTYARSADLLLLVSARPSNSGYLYNYSFWVSRQQAA
jgi:uridine kinase